MAYPDKLLAADEKVVKHLHPHWLTLVLPTFVFIATVAAATFGILAIPEGSARLWLRLAVLVLAAVVLVTFTLVPVLRWSTTHYVITTHRVMFRTGILHRHGKDVAFPRITDVAYSQTLWDRIVGAGRLTIESAGEGPAAVLDNVPNSDETQQLINHLVEEDSDRRAREAGQYYRDARHAPQVDLDREQTSQLPPGDRT